MTLRRMIAGCLPIALAVAALSEVPGRAGAQSISVENLQDWFFYNNSGWNHLRRGDVERAAKLFRKASEIAKADVAHNPELLARSYTDFALVLIQQGRADEAEPLARWALAVREARRGKDSEPVAQTLHVLALAVHALDDYPRAEALLTRSLAIWEKRQGHSGPRVALVLNDLATLYADQRKYDQAEPLFRRVLEMPTRALPANALDRGTALVGLASLYTTRGESDRAESIGREILAFLERVPSTDYAGVRSALDPYLARLRKLGRGAEADSLDAAAQAVRNNPATAFPPPGNPRPSPGAAGPRSRST